MQIKTSWHWICPHTLICRCHKLYLLCQLLLLWNLFPNFQRCSLCSLNGWLSMRKAFDICLVFGKTVLPGISVFPTFPYSEKRRLNPRMLKREVQKQRFISQNHYTTVASLCIMQASASQNCNPTNSTRYRTTWLWLSGLFSFLHSLYDPCELTWPTTLPTKSKFYSMKPHMKSQVWLHTAGTQITWSQMGSREYSSTKQYHIHAAKKKGIWNDCHNSAF